MSSFDISTLFEVEDLVAVVTGGGSGTPTYSLSSPMPSRILTLTINCSPTHYTRISNLLLGLGRVISRALATNGARRVYILGRRLNALHETASSHPDIIVPIVADVTDTTSLTAAAEQIREEVGYIDFLVAGAGMVYLHPPPAPTPTPVPDASSASEGLGSGSVAVDDKGKAGLALSPSGKIQVGRVLPPAATAAQVESFLLGTTPDEFLTSYRVNTMGVFYTIAAFISLLDAGNRRSHDDSTKGDSEQQEAKGEGVQVKRKSHVVAIASVSGQNNNATGGCAYGMSKAAVIQLMGQMMRILAPLGIRGNTLSPGGMFLIPPFFSLPSSLRLGSGMVLTSI
jgi:NAD(P)-dependent dehydrogenase (short-subunit alcohol dehydrogenase family)